MARKPWTKVEIAKVKQLHGEGKNPAEIARVLPGRNRDQVAGQITRLRHDGKVEWKPVPKSPYPSYDKPLVWEGDALILPDPEFPFHHDEWINKIVGLARAWGITHLVVAGDMVHLESLSSWEPSWTEDNQEELEAANLPREIRHAAAGIEALLSNFQTIDLILGNHEGRFLRALDNVLSPGLLLKFLGISKIRSAPYYFMTVVSNGEPFQIEHPKTTARGAPGVLADRFQAHILMAHSHKIGMTPSRSGEWQGWHIGCCVDERKLAYAAQRHSAGDPHKLGAAIVRNGYVYPLFEGWTDWEWMGRQE